MNKINIISEMQDDSHNYIPKTHRIEKKLVLKKINKALLSPKLDQLFENSQTYLNTDSNIAIGK